MNQFQEAYMKEALKQANKAASIGETPVGAVIVHHNQIIARGYNKREIKKNALCHAEIIAINKAAKKLGGWRLPDCDLYVTLEPCCMCAGAIIQARIDRVYFGAYDPKGGCAGSVTDLFEENLFNYHVQAAGGILETECAQVLTRFFQELRKHKKQRLKKNQECEFHEL